MNDGKWYNLRKGKKSKAYNAIKNAVQAVVNNGNLADAIYDSVKNPIKININGFDMRVGDRIVDGIFKLETVFIK